MSLLTDYVAHPIRVLRGLQRSRHSEARDEPEAAPVEPAAPLALEDTGSAYVLRFDLPGVERSALTVETFPDRIAIRGRRLAAITCAGAIRLVHEPFTGEFAREVRLPGEIDTELVRAHYTDGVLEVHAPKRRV